jgi:hypothetical protein
MDIAVVYFYVKLNNFIDIFLLSYVIYRQFPTTPSGSMDSWDHGGIIMKRFVQRFSLFLLTLAVLSGIGMAGKRVAKARINNGAVKGSIVLGTIPSGWRVMSYVQGLIDPANAVVCLEQEQSVGEGSCLIPVCGGGLAADCEVDEYGNLDHLTYLSGTDFQGWPGSGTVAQNFLSDLDAEPSKVYAVVYDEDTSSAVFVVVFP